MPNPWKTQKKKNIVGTKTAVHTAIKCSYGVTDSDDILSNIL